MLTGQKYCATHPTNTPNLSTFIRSAIIKNPSLRDAPVKLSLNARRPRSPFGPLPLELVYRICSYLPGEALTALTQASLSVQIVTQHNYFWAKAVQWGMPWFWELEDIHRESGLLDGVNCKRLFLWLDWQTAPRYGMEDVELIGVANRRRIWGVCEQLAGLYFRGVERGRVVECV